MNDTQIEESLEGKIIDDFQIMEQFGHGSSSKVHIAKHIPTDNFVAAKIVNLKNSSEGVYNGLLREMSVFMQVLHPNIVSLYRVSFYEEYLIFFMELAQKGTLFKHVTQSHGLSESESRRIFIQLLAAVLHLHLYHFIVHRDLKLDNILLDSSGNVKIIDFGLANTFYCNSLRSFAGTPGYTPPEAMAGNEYGEKFDVWSLGIVLYAMLTAQLPFSSQISDFRKLIREAKNLAPIEGISNDLQDLINQMLEPFPMNRPTMLQVFKHTWVQGYISIPSQIEPKPLVFFRTNDRTEIMNFKRNPLTIDPSIIKMCEGMGIDEMTLCNDLNEGKINQNTTTYFILSRPCKIFPPPIIGLPRLRRQSNGITQKSVSTKSIQPSGIIKKSIPRKYSASPRVINKMLC